MNCKPNDAAMVTARVFYRCPFCGAQGSVDLRPQVVRVTQLVLSEPVAVWAIEKPFHEVPVDFSCGTHALFPRVDALPDYALQRLPKLGEEEDQPAAHSLPKTPEVTS